MPEAVSSLCWGARGDWPVIDQHRDCGTPSHNVCRSPACPPRPNSVADGVWHCHDLSARPMHVLIDYHCHVEQASTAQVRHRSWFTHHPDQRVPDLGPQRITVPDLGQFTVVYPSAGIGGGTEHPVLLASTRRTSLTGLVKRCMSEGAWNIQR